MIKTIPLKKNTEFLRLYKKGRFFAGRYMVLYIMENKREYCRLGIAVSKKVGKSVKRNRVRRLIRENYRFYEQFVKTGFDYVFAARPADRLPLYSEIKSEMKFLFKKLNVFDQVKWDCSKSL